MNRMKGKIRTVAACITVIALMSMITGCGSRDAGDSRTDISDERETGEIPEQDETEQRPAEPDNLQSRPEEEPEEASREEAAPEPEIQIRMQPLFDSLTLFDEQFTPDSNWQNICDKLGVQNPGEVTEENVIQEIKDAGPLYEGEGRGGTAQLARIMPWKDPETEMVYYTYSYSVSGPENRSIDNTYVYYDTSVTYDPDGTLQSAATAILGPALELGADITPIEGLAGYISEHNITSIAVFFRSIGMEEADPQRAAEADKDLIEYEYLEPAVYETEYGPAMLGYVIRTEERGTPDSIIYFYFMNEEAPWEILDVREYIALDGVHGLVMTVYPEKEDWEQRWNVEIPVMN